MANNTLNYESRFDTPRVWWWQKWLWLVKLVMIVISVGICLYPTVAAVIMWVDYVNYNGNDKANIITGEGRKQLAALFSLMALGVIALVSSGWCLAIFLLRRLQRKFQRGNPSYVSTT